jgi:hypothetical protein
LPATRPGADPAGPLLDGVPDQPNPARAPLGHSAAAHFLFGFCLSCPGRDAAAEVVGWRTWAVTRGVMAWPGARDG